MQKKKFPSDKRTDRLGQVTIGKNEDVRVERHTNERGEMSFILADILFYDTDIPRPPHYEPVLRIADYEKFVQLSNLLNEIIDDVDNHQGAHLPIEMSEYDTRFKG